MVHNQRRRGQKSNANNQRVKKTNTDTNETTLYAWTSDRIFGEYDAQGNLIQETVYLGNTPFGILKPDGVYRIYADQIDTPRLITDDTNRPVWQWDAKPFGDSQPNEDLDGDSIPFHYNLRFPGQYYDAETKTHYNFNRDYEPETGRYVQSDPIGLDGGMNSYLYVTNNPLITKDTTGLFKEGGQGCPVIRGTLHYRMQVTVAEILEANGYDVTLEAKFVTPLGTRCVDVLGDSSSWYDFSPEYWALEIKVGYTTLSTFVENQLKKDDYLLRSKKVIKVSWHFLGDAAYPSEGLDRAIRSYGFVGINNGF